MNYSNLLELCKKKLKASGIDSYQIDAMLIICNNLGLSKEELIFRPNDLVEEKNCDNILGQINRRISGEPISHIISRRSFYEDDFFVNSDVLDPRPDSEVLVESVISKCGHAINNATSSLTNVSQHILELGVGSGCLLLTILKKLPGSRGVGVDISRGALEVAARNAKNLNLLNRVSFVNSNWFDNIKKEKFDIIISNPPYIKTSDINNLQTEVKDHEPMLALDGGEDGLDYYREIANKAGDFLIMGGYLFLEIGQNQEIDVISIFEKKNFKFVESKKDLGSIIRCLIFKKDENI